MTATEASRHELLSRDNSNVQENGLTATLTGEEVHQSATLNTADGAPTASKLSDSKPDADFNPTDELLTAESPDHIAKGNWPVVHGMKDNIGLPSPQPPTQKTEESEGAVSGGSTEDPSKMAKDDTANPTTSEPLCEGDTTLTYPLLPPHILSGLFERLCTEVHFLKMMHQGGEVPRFVAVQGSVSTDGTQPVYRHPSDETLLCVPFTPAVQAIREVVEKQVGHEMNHVLIQCYRGGNDYISEHSDKTLDIVEGSYIANVSLGAQRTMVFRTKRDAPRRETTTPAKKPEAAEEKDATARNGEEEEETPAIPPTSPTTDTTTPSKRQTIRIPMPHNSLLKMGLSTNAKWLHGIRPDKRSPDQRTPHELAFNGYRISLTFRHIGTFLSPPPGASHGDGDKEGEGEGEVKGDDIISPIIWGQGATAKTREAARPVVNGQTDQAVAMLRAFGRENNSSAAPAHDGGACYARGFDVLHVSAAPRYFACGDTMADGRVRVALAELGVKYARGSIGSNPKKSPNTTTPTTNAVGHLAVVPVRFEADDAARTAVTGDVAILLYLDARHPRGKKGGEAEVARVYTRFHAAVALGYRWKALWAAGAGAGVGPAGAERRGHMRALFRSDIGIFDAWLSENLGLLGAGRRTGVPPPVSSSPSSSSTSSSEAGHVFLAGGAEPSIADYAFWPVLQDMAEEWRRAGGGFEETWVERGKYTALEKYYVDFSGRSSVVGIFGERAGALYPERKRQGGGGGGGGKKQEEDDDHGRSRVAGETQVKSVGSSKGEN